MIEIKDLSKPVRLTVNIKSGDLMHAFLLETLKNNTDVDKMFNIWIENYLGLSKYNKTVAELYADYFMNNIDKVINRTELRGLNIVNGNRFKQIFTDKLQEILSILNYYGFILEDVELQGNSKAYKCVKKV